MKTISEITTTIEQEFDGLVLKITSNEITYLAPVFTGISIAYELGDDELIGVHAEKLSTAPEHEWVDLIHPDAFIAWVDQEMHLFTLRFES